MKFLKNFNKRPALVIDESKLKTTMPYFVWVIIKFFIYGSLGMVIEIVFNNLTRLLMATGIGWINRILNSFETIVLPKDIPHAYSFPWEYLYTLETLYSIITYGVGFYLMEFIYSLYMKLKKKPNILLRAIPYTVAIFLTELVLGWAYKLVFQLPEFVWRYEGSFLVTTTFSILPHWFFAAMAAEVVIKKMHEKDLEYAFRTDYDFVRDSQRNKASEDKTGSGS